MATTYIEQDIENITGVADADDQFVISAQKFVVASVPKNLLKWASTFTIPGNHGGNTSDGVKITMPVGTDSILDVSRNGFSAKEVPYNMKGFIGSSASLYKSTNTYPKYYLDDANPGEGVRIIVKPIPTDSETAIALYVDFLKIDDDCDLRNVVIFRASAQEFERLSRGKITDWTDLVLPISPTLPTISNLSVAAVPPSIPSLTTVTFDSATLSDAFASQHRTTTVLASSTYTGSAPTYTKPTLVVTGFPTISWNLPSRPVPSIINAESSSTGGAEVDLTKLATAPAYIPPVMQSPDWSDVENWITTEEDSEMLSARIQAIQSQVGEFQSRLGQSQAVFNKENAEYQAKLQIALQDASQANSGDGALIQKFSNEVGVYQAEVNTIISANQGQIGEWQQQNALNIQKYSSDIQNEQANFNQENVLYQSAIQESMAEIQIRNQLEVEGVKNSLQASISNKDRDLQKQLQNSSNAMQAVINNNNNTISLFQAESSQYQAKVTSEIQEYQQNLSGDLGDYQNKVALYNADLQKYQSESGEQVQKIASATQNAAFYSKEADKYYQWANAEIQMYIQNNSKMIGQKMAVQAAAQQQRS